MITTEIVYKNRDNSNVVSFFEDNVAMDFTSITRVILRLYNSNLVLQATTDSNDSPNLLSWSSNQITFDIAGLALANARYLAEVLVYDATHPNGQVIAHPRSPNDRLIFKYVTS